MHRGRIEGDLTIFQPLGYDEAIWPIISSANDAHGLYTVAHWIEYEFGKVYSKQEGNKPIDHLQKATRGRYHRQKNTQAKPGREVC